MRMLKLFVLVAVMAASVTPVSAGMLLKHEDGVKYADIKKCLENLGLDDNVHFRAKSGGGEIVQFNRPALESFGNTLGAKPARDKFIADVEACWRKPAKKS